MPDGGQRTARPTARDYRLGRDYRASATKSPTCEVV
jgi:hypothetical protein